ncbi:MAG: chorismate synthase [Clostridiales Family XIII bacterium]|jgi:chorismate synthase|nr:chorismate synthase [Clostridiales Family XIII bacterium]
MDTWGEKFRITIFGESHGPEVGVVIEGLPEGTRIDHGRIAKELTRRAPGRSKFSTTRNESDEPVILSGIEDGVSTDEPIRCVIRNENQRPGDYGSALRPGHADWTGLLKYGPSISRAGGGRFSGRLTAPLVFAGAIAKSVLAEQGIDIFGRIKSIGKLSDSIDLSAKSSYDTGRLKAISEKEFPADDDMEDPFKEAILAAKADGDSVGGVIESVALGAIAGLGEPFFGSVESTLSTLFFSVPAVKGVEFGKGFTITELRGSEANDPIALDGGKVISETNNNGGILGGIANGMPIIARVAVKPTASIAKDQRTVDPGKGGIDGDEMKETTIRVHGRHDPSIVPRAVPVIEAVTAIGLLDLYLR